MDKVVAIIGASGAIGRAFIDQLTLDSTVDSIHTFSRQPVPASDRIISHTIDYTTEQSLADAVSALPDSVTFSHVIVTTGILHDGSFSPEKSLSQLSADAMAHLYQANTIFPSLALKHFLPKLNKHERAVFAVLSARVGSISDNRLGGWYAYRASKAALNMVIKSAAIETSRLRKKQIIVGLHPGTVDSKLSKPFQANVPADHLFTPKFAATALLRVMDSLTPDHSGHCFAWDGKEILP